MPDGTALLEQAEDLLDQRCMGAALELFHAAVAAGASEDRCAAGRWMAWMLLGDFEQAWRESDAIRHRGAPDPHRFWNGEDIDGKSVMLRCLHGFGDAVQMLRFAPRLSARCAALTVEVPPRLLDVMQCFSGIERVITWGALAPTVEPVWDVQIEVMELPYFLRATQRDLAINTPYLKLPGQVSERVRSAMGAQAKPRVGLVWAAGDWNPSRTLPTKFVESLLRSSDCEFWNLQGGKEQRQWRELNGADRHRDATDCGDGIMSLAAVIERLDLVVTVDTLAAHLAGALGKPAWVLLQNAADWRWMMNRNDTPWYPTLKLYRQHSAGDWQSVLTDVERDLGRWLRSESHVDLAG